MLSDTAQYDFSVYKGVDKNLPLTFVQDDGSGCCCEPSEKTAVNLIRTGAVMTIRDSVFTAICDSLSTENGRIKVGYFVAGEFKEATASDESADTLMLVFPHDVTEKYAFRKAVYDLILIAGEDETRQVLLTGTVSLLKGVTYAGTD
jgi:hypothetical protein